MIKKTVKEIARVKSCCPHRKLPYGMTWQEAEKERWLRGTDEKGTVYFCPQGRDAAENR